MVLTKGGRDLPKHIPGLKKLTKFDPPSHQRGVCGVSRGYGSLDPVEDAEMNLKMTVRSDVHCLAGV